MFGFFIGTACLIGLVYVLFGRRGRRRCRGRGYGGWDGEQGWGRRWMLRRLFHRLDTSPGQEEVIRRAASDVERAALDARGSVRQTRGEVADLMRSEALDADGLGVVLSKLDDDFHTLRRTVSGALAEVHEVLDPVQRERLARFIERGRGRRFPGGPYREQAPA